MCFCTAATVKHQRPSICPSDLRVLVDALLSSQIFNRAELKAIHWVCRSLAQALVVLDLDKQAVSPAGTPSDAAPQLTREKFPDSGGNPAPEVLRRQQRAPRGGEEPSADPTVEQREPTLQMAAVRRRFRELSMAVHPDKCTHPGAEQVLSPWSQPRRMFRWHPRLGHAAAPQSA